MCLIIPTTTNQIKRGKQGNWLMMTRLAELPPNARMQTHDLQLSYLTEDELQKSLACGYHDRTAHLGRVYAHDRTPSKKIDRSNKSSDIRCDGVIVLSDIPKRLIFRNAENDKRYVESLTFKAYGDDSVIYTGAICIDDIPSGYILTDPGTGKKYVKTRFKKMKSLDTYMNTHHLVIAGPSGAEIEIGRFKEWSRTDIRPIQDAQQKEEHDTTVTPRPTPKSIDGMRF